ncbi:MAG: PIN domain-containing protein [Desulfobulbaceae bacterium]|nr:PIN domain-containing protein [Desulfobulbaceae bacterium]
MKLLLDTHIFLWSLLEPEKLGKNTTEILENSGNEIWLSPITLWETIVLAGKGRISLNKEPGEWLRMVLKQIPLREAPLNFNVAIESRYITVAHHDPADRFLAATAKIYNLTLVTADQNLLACPDIQLLENR